MSMSVQEMLKDHDMALDPFVSVTVANGELWTPLFNVTNEMVALFTGTSIIPDLIVQINGLDKSFLYAVILEFKQITDYKWRYTNGNWRTGGSSDRPSNNTVYMHPDSIQSGSSWMKEPINFNKIKIATSKFAVDTVTPKEKNNTILLNSHHKYMPVVKIFQVGGMFSLVQFKELELCQFLAVSSYKNNLMFQLKGNARSESSERSIKIRKPPLLSCPTHPSGLLRGSQTHDMQTRPVGIVVSQMINLKLNPIEEDKIKRLTHLTTSKLFPPEKLNFVNFVDLYKVKKTITDTPYTVSNYIEDIKNKSLRIPNSSLVYEEQKAVSSQPSCQLKSTGVEINVSQNLINLPSSFSGHINAASNLEQESEGNPNDGNSDIKAPETVASSSDVIELHQFSKLEGAVGGDVRLEGAVGGDVRLEGAVGGDVILEGAVGGEVNKRKRVHMDLLQDLKENFGDHVINVEEEILEDILEAYLLVQDDESSLLDDLSFLDFPED